MLKNAFHVPRSGTRSVFLRNGTELVPILKIVERNGTLCRKNSFRSKKIVPKFLPNSGEIAYVSQHYEDVPGVVPS